MGNVLIDDEMRDPIYLECDCGGEVLRVQYDDDIDSYDVAIYTLDWRQGWKQRLKLIWKILTTGEPYGDRMIIKRKEMAELGMYMADIGLDRLRDKIDKSSVKKT